MRQSWLAAHTPLQARPIMTARCSGSQTDQTALRTSSLSTTANLFFAVASISPLCLVRRVESKKKKTPQPDDYSQNAQDGDISKYRIASFPTADDLR
ncbi:hypothetical protein RJ55_01642 [Drechmeria coniospora]|nr:hypothetical protein RJ55_01642 [Drechmeria coniospora]